MSRRSRIITNSIDLCLREFGPARLLPRHQRIGFALPRSTADFHVVHVLEFRSCQQMSRITARRVVTRVTCFHSFRRIVDESMNEKRLAFDGANQSVTLFVAGPSPRPTLVRPALIDLLPDTLHQVPVRTILVMERLVVERLVVERLRMWPFGVRLLRMRPFSMRSLGVRSLGMRSLGVRCLRVRRSGDTGPQFGALRKALGLGTIAQMREGTAFTSLALGCASTRTGHDKPPAHLGYRSNLGTEVVRV